MWSVEVKKGNCRGNHQGPSKKKRIKQFQSYSQ
jgi:hypothetical protein